MTRTLHARVAIVLDERQIAINAGSKEGVVPGSKVEILRSVDIPDPETPGLVLGTALVKKGKMIIDTVDEAFSIARFMVPFSAFRVIGGSTSGPNLEIVKRESQEAPGKIFVSPGDPVHVFIEDESE